MKYHIIYNHNKFSKYENKAILVYNLFDKQTDEYNSEIHYNYIQNNKNKYKCAF